MSIICIYHLATSLAFLGVSETIEDFSMSLSQRENTVILYVLYFAYLCSGESGNMSKLSETELLGLGVASAVTPFLKASAWKRVREY